MGLRVSWLLCLLLLAAVAPVTASVRTVPPNGGDPSLGEHLFNGAVRFQKGGKPCSACHSIAGAGGAVGPPLTTVYARYGGAKTLDALLTTIAFPAMVPVFSNHPLTARERGALIAYLARVSQTPVRSAAPPLATPTGSRLVLLALFYAALLALLAQFVWRKRLTGVRRALVTRSTR
ncbi:MAG: c-type cytochrome [Vulcanimicrobiaceae bacterium]